MGKYKKMQYMIYFKDRFYVFRFYRQIIRQAKDAVTAYQKQGFYAIRRNVMDRKGVGVWAIYQGPKKKLKKDE